MKKILLISFSLIAITSFSQTAGPNNPGTVATAPSASCLGCPGEVWNNEMYAQTQDNTVADVSLQQNGFCFQSTCFVSRYLFASNFGFSIPSNATINGITVDIYRNAQTASTIADTIVQLSQASTPVGQNKAMPNVWPTTATYYTYGTSTDMWGTALTYSDINNAGFGIFLKIKNTSTTAGVPAYVDHIRITIDYSTFTGIHLTQTASPSSFGAYVNNNELTASFNFTEIKNSGSINIYNVVGEKMITRSFANLSAGKYEEKFDVSALASGIYLVQFSSEGNVQTRKVFIQN